MIKFTSNYSNADLKNLIWIHCQSDGLHGDIVLILVTVDSRPTIRNTRMTFETPHIMGTHVHAHTHTHTEQQRSTMMSSSLNDLETQRRVMNYIQLMYSVSVSMAISQITNASYDCLKKNYGTPTHKSSPWPPWWSAAGSGLAACWRWSPPCPRAPPHRPARAASSWRASRCCSPAPPSGQQQHRTHSLY